MTPSFRALLAACALPAVLMAGEADRPAAVTPDELFRVDKVWEATLEFTPENLRALEPTFGPGNYGGGFGGGGGFRLLGPEGGRNGVAAARGLEFNFVPADLTLAGRTFRQVAVRYKGNGTYLNSQYQLKRSLKVDLDHFLPDQRLAGLGKLNFHSNVTDPGWMNEVLSHRLYRDAGVPAPRTAYAKLYYDVPGRHDRTYVGLFSLVENVDNTFEERHYGTKKGALFKPVTRELFRYLGDDWAAYNQIYDPKNELTAAQQMRVIEFAQIVTSAPQAEFAAKLAEYVDLDLTARFLAVTVMLSKYDSILDNGQNYYLYLHPRTNRFSFIPWDLDHTFGNFVRNGAPEALSIDFPTPSANFFVDRLLNTPAFYRLYRAKIAEFTTTIFEPARIARQVDELVAALGPAVRQESVVKHEDFTAVASGEYILRRTGRGGVVQPIKPFVAGRYVSLQAQLRAKPYFDENAP